MEAKTLVVKAPLCKSRGRLRAPQMSEVGQNAKYSERANNFRFAPMNGIIRHARHVRNVRKMRSRQLLQSRSASRREDGSAQCVLTL
jgi:hypothetical protein